MPSDAGYSQLSGRELLALGVKTLLWCGNLLPNAGRPRVFHDSVSPAGSPACWRARYGTVQNGRHTGEDVCIFAEVSGDYSQMAREAVAVDDYMSLPIL